MKKILLSATILTLTISLVGCGNSAHNATINSLCNQLDETANAVTNVETVNPSRIDVSKNALEKIASKSTYNDIIKTQNALLNEEHYKTEILTKTAKIKKCLNSNCSLSKAQISAVKDLTSNLCKYTNSVTYSTNELESSVKSIASMKKKEDKNAEKINAKINRLACNSNCRSAYYENIINTLDQLGCYFCDQCPQTEAQPEKEEPVEKEFVQEQPVDGEKTEKQGLTKNIDTYLPNGEKVEEPLDEEFNYPNYDRNIMPIQRPNVYNRYNRFHLSRNIDTYGPMPNIYGNNLGYGFNGGYGLGAGYGVGYGAGYGVGNGYYGNLNSNNFNRYYLNETAQMVNKETDNEISSVLDDENKADQPYQETEIEQRLETEEKVNENNVLENVEENSELKLKEVFKAMEEDDLNQPITAH